MRKINSLIVMILVIISFSVHSQENEAPLPCDTPSQDNYFDNNPGARKEADKLEEATKNFIKLKKRQQSRGLARKAGEKYIVPIVFHVFGTDFAGKKVDDALVKDALKKTNQDFNGLNNDYDKVSNQFRNLRSTLDVDFKLAEFDPNGNPTTGINYYNTRSGFGADNIKDEEIAKFAWDNYKYFNVYILLDLKEDGKLNRSGVAWYPNKNQSDNNVARAVFNGRYLGTNGSENFRRILTHEFGHYLNLAHTFDNGCSGVGDNVDDTPATTSNAGSCLVTQESCPGAGIPNSENFMDYTECYRMFTRGQVSRMQAALEHVARKPLWQTSNHATVFLQKTTEPRLFYDFTTFSESFENDGSIGGGREVKIRLVDGPKFSRIGTLPSSNYTVENLPSGLGLQVISSTNTEAVVRLTGKATTHANSDNLRNIKLTFNNGAFTGFSAVNIKGYSKPNLRIEFNDPYESTYISPERLTQVAVDGSNFAAFGINPGKQRPRYEMNIENEKLMFGYDAAANHVAVTADKKVLFIEEGTTIGANLDWEHDDRNRVILDATYQTWKGKRGFAGIRIERASFPGTYYYGWARLEVSADGKIVRFIDFYSHKDPDAVVKAGETNKPLIALAKPVFFEAETNNGTFTESIDIILEGSATFTSQNLNGSHFTISNLPQGLSANIQKVNSKLAKLTLQGTASNHLKGDGALAKLTFSPSAFSTAPGNTMDFKVQVRFFDPYGVTYIDAANLFPLINSKNTGQWFYLDTDFDFGDNSRYAVNHYTDSGDNQDYVIINARGKGFTMNPTNFHATSLQQGSQINASSAFVSTQWGINSAPRFAGKGVASNGKTIYSGLRFRDRAGRLHYGWVQVRATPDGSGAQLLAASFNRKPNEGITVGQVENVHCYAGTNMNEKFDDYSGAIGTFNFEQFTQKSDFPQNYTNFKSRIIKVRPGKNNFSIKDDGIKTSGTNIIGMWIDLNGDKDFDDSGEQIHMSNPYSAGSDYAGEVNLPNVNGSYALRVIMKNETEAANPKPSSCDFFLHGEVEDYTINISNSNPLYPVAKFEMPTSISAKGLLKVTDASTREPDSWSWTFEGGEPATFNGKTPPSIYYEKEGSYKVSLVVTKGSVSGNLEKTLTVKAHPTSYCEVSRRGTYAGRNDVTKVVLGSITNSTAKGGTGYGDFTSQSTNLVEGQTYPIELTTYQQITNTTNDASTNLVVWIDWNRNNEFSVDEIAYERRAIASDTADMVLSGNITVPKIYSNGSSLMRIIRYYSYDKEDRPRCGEIVEADIEDYTVNLSGSGVVVNKPVTKFIANATTISKGGSVNFTDQSTNTPTAWSWTFTGGTPATSSVQNPSVTYSTAGTYQVILTATNSGGSNTITKTSYITVNDSDPNPSNYCASAGTRIQYEWIAGVKVGTFINTSIASKYLDVTSKKIPLSVGVATATILTPGYSGNPTKEYFKVWIDYNQNGTFDTNEVAFDSGSAKDNAQTGTITVPASAKSGETRMRISMKYNGVPASACGNIGDGSVQDYTVNIGGIVVNAPVAKFTGNSTTIKENESVSFTDQSTNAPTSWSWTFTGGTPATSTVQNPSVTYSTAGTYQVVLTATNAGGSNTVTKTGYITVETVDPNPSNYCASAGTRIQYEWIAGVKVGTFTNTSTASKYLDLTSKKIPLSVGVATETILTPGYTSNATKEYFKVWIDYNQNGTFDTNEVAFDSGSAKDNAQTGTITVPTNAKTGETRMRVSMKYNGAPASACGNIGDGSVQDFTVNIGNTTTPITPYCESAGTRIQYEWIAGVEVGSFTNTSTASKYLDLTSKKIPLSKGVATAVTLTPGYASTAAKEYFKVWIDYNQDGTFDTNEVAFNSSITVANAQTGTITVPASAKLGETRMRVSMKYNGAPASACGNIGDGSVQDFTVNINGSSAKEGPSNSELVGADDLTIKMYPNPVSKELTLSFGTLIKNNQANLNIVIFDIGGRNVKEIKEIESKKSIRFNVENLKKGTYILQINNGKELTNKIFVKK